MRVRTCLHAALAVGIACAGAARGEENYESWPVIQPLFESTGGGGVMIGGYDPVVTGNLCRTDFTTHEPGGRVSHNSVEFDAQPAQGGVLCVNGRWRAKDGGAQGTTPYRVFIKDGVKRGSP